MHMSHPAQTQWDGSGNSCPSAENLWGGGARKRIVFLNRIATENHFREVIGKTNHAKSLPAQTHANDLQTGHFIHIWKDHPMGKTNPKVKKNDHRKAIRKQLD